jgi:hypothetical protein
MGQKGLVLRALALSLVISVGAAGLGWACSSMGPDKHMGVVKSIDTPEGAFVIVDAETGKPIQFMASNKLLEGVKVNDKAVVTFKMEGDRLLAEKIEVGKS